MIETLQLFLNPQFMTMVLVAVAAFATIMTLAMPFLQTDKLNARMKGVASERAALRARERARLYGDQAKSGLRKSPKSYMKRVVEQLNLHKLFDADAIRSKLRMAGMRGQAPVVTYLFFRLIMPIILFAGALFYLFVVNDLGRPAMVRLLISFAAGFGGFYVPNLFIANRIQKRQLSIQRAFPDSLDLLLICVESGMSIEASFRKVSEEIGSQSIELAEEFMLTTAELSYLQDRRQAYDNFGKRTGLPGVKSVVTSLIQAERYGTPLGQALRVMAQENREMRMALAEKKAAALPPKLTVPMILFFLPVLFIVILGPAGIRVSQLN